MKKYILVMLITLGLILSFQGCTSMPTETSPLPSDSQSAVIPPSSGTTKPEDTEPEPVVTCQNLPQQVENPENLPVLKWVCLTELVDGRPGRVWNEDAAHDLNKMLADRNLPFRVQFIILTIDTPDNNSQPGPLWFSQPEAQEALQDADLIYARMSAGEMTQYLLPLTDYVTGNKEPNLNNAVVHETNWLSGTVDGQIYGISTFPQRPQSNGWCIDTALLEKSGLTPADLSVPLWEADEVLAKLYAANGNKAFFHVRGSGVSSQQEHSESIPDSYFPTSLDNMFPRAYRNIGSCFAVDYSAPTPTVINKLDTDTVRNLLAAIQRYRAAGYVTEDSGKALVRYTDSIDGSAVYETDGDTCIPITKAYYPYSSAQYNRVTGICATTKQEQAAAKLLQLVAEDEAFQMMLFHGKEGRDYTITDGYYEIITREDGTDYSLSFLSGHSYFSGLTSQPESVFRNPGAENWYYKAYEGMTTKETYRAMMDSAPGLEYPVIFDYTGYEDTVEKMVSVFNKYFHVLTASSSEAMLKELKETGCDQLLEHLQAQLDKWVAEHPDW